MRRIKNSEALEQKVTAFNLTLFDKRRSDFIKPAQKLANFKAEPNKLAKYKLSDSKINEYLQKIKNEYQTILSANVKHIKKLIKEFEKIIPAKSITTEFHEELVKVMRYDDLREKEFLVLLQGLNIRTCVYCHSQSTLVIEKQADNSFKALLQLDHKYPKSEYPFLCTSFYNLYPICGNCNLAKSSLECGFDLYVDNDNLDILTFGLDDKSIAKYWKSKNRTDLKITITASKKDKKLLNPYNSMFLIKEIYDMQIDVAEELVHQQSVYNSEYKDTLVESFKALFPDQSMINRLIIGNYDKPEDMLLRPMAKFVQEIARDIDLIPKLKDNSPN
jgi:hypothetical protein